MLSMFGRVFRGGAQKVEAPGREALTMRALEPRVLLDAAALETALEAADMADASDIATPAPDDASPDGSAEPARDLSRDVVFIDGGIAEIGSLLAEIDPSVEVHVLDLASDGVTQIAAVLEGREDLSAVHIFAHGAQGALSLGSGAMSSETITGSHVQALQRIGAALGADGDILLYGCNFGAGPEGRAAAEALARVTGADVAASDDLTGAAERGGDWDLEVSAGQVEAESFAFEGFKGVLGSFEIGTVQAPTVTLVDQRNVSGTTVGGVGSTAVWADAGTVDDNGTVVDVDVVATVIAESSATLVGVHFGSRAIDSGTGDATLDDFRVQVVNASPQTGASYATENGGTYNQLGEQSVQVRWEVFLAGTYDPATGTGTRPQEGSISFTISDIDGGGGLPNTREEVAASLAGLSSYTVQDPTNMAVTLDTAAGEIRASGTAPHNDEQPSWIQFTWDTVNQLDMTYVTHTTNAYFNHDGDGDLVFTNPDTSFATGIDLDADDSSGATGSSYQTIFYTDATNPGAPVAIADGDITVDNDGDRATRATIRLTNALADDVLAADAAILAPLGLSASVDVSVAGEILVEITGAASVTDYQTAIQSITYASTDPTPDQSVRSIDVQVFDGAFASGVANTTVSFGTLIGQPATVRDVFVGLEDTLLAVDAAGGLLANDSDPQNQTLSVFAATDAGGNAIPVNAVGAPIPASHTLPSGATLTLYADGSFDYVPVPDFSGVDTFNYEAADTDGNRAANYAAINIQAVADTPTAAPTLSAASSDEDATSATLTLTPSSTDTDGSEAFRIAIGGVPVGVTVTDGLRAFTATAQATSFFADGWTLDNITIVPPDHSDKDITLQVTTQAIEPNGSTQSVTEEVTFVIDAVADAPVLAALPGAGGPGASLAVASFVDVALADADGSEAIDRYTISAIDPALSFTLGITPLLPDVNGEIVVAAADWAALRVVGPALGTNPSDTYTFDVTARASEVNAENGVSVLSADSNTETVTLFIDDVDDPVNPRDDAYRIDRGADATITPILNDDVPDGGALITSIDGQAVTAGSSITLASGDATVTLNADGSLTLASLPGAPESFSFSYTLEDSDGSTGTADIAIILNPTWRLTGDASVAEGAAAAYTLELTGPVGYGQTVGVDLALIDVDTSAGDVADLEAAVLAAIAGREGWSYDDGRLEYSYVNDGYAGTYEAAGPALIDISTTGTALGLANVNNTTQRPIGFAFDYFGVSHTTLAVDDDGYAFFGTDNSNTGARLSIYDAFAFNPTRGPGDVYIQTIGQPGSRQFIAQWEEMTGNAGTETATFQIILNEADGTIEYRYEDVDLEGTGQDFGAGVAIRLRDGAGTTIASPTGSVANGSRIVWTPGSQAAGALAISLGATQDGVGEGPEDFRLALSGPAGSTLDPAFEVTTTILDDDPEARDDTGLTTPEEVPLDIAVLGNDLDHEGAGLTVSAIAGTAVNVGDVIGVAGGTVELLASGELRFTPTADFNGPVTFAYTVTDASGDTDAADVSLTVTARNDAPTLTAPTTASTQEDTDLVFAGTLTVGDVDSASVTVTLSVAQGTLFSTAIPGVTRSGQGTGTLVLTGAPGDVNSALDGLTVTPNADYFGTDTLSILVDDGEDTTSASVALDVAPVADVADDRAELLGTDVVTMDLLANDTFEGPVTDLVVTAPPANGTAIVNADRTVTFTWTGPPSGLDAFGYTVTAGGVSETATAIVVRHPDPTAADDAGTTTEDQVLTVAADGLLGNDDAVPAPALDYDSVAISGASGTWDSAGGESPSARPFAWTGGVTLDPSPATARPGIGQALVFDGTGGATAADFGTLNAGTDTSDATFETWLRYDPAGLANGQIVFETGGADDGMSIALTQDATGTGPFDNVRVQFDDSGTILVLHGDLGDLLDGNVAGEFNHIAVVYDAGATDTVSLYVNGVLLDAASVTGLDDWDSGSGAGLGTAANGPNVAGLDAFTGEIAHLRFTEAALDQGEVKNAFDAVAGLAATPATLTTALGAAVTVNADGSYIYDATALPAVQALRAGETITDTFDYTVTDANGLTDTATATITITGVNDAPVGADASATLAEDGVHTFAPAEFGFADPVDGPGDVLDEVVFTTVPAAGQLVFDDGATAFTLAAGDAVGAAALAAGHLTFRPAPDANGSPYASFTFQVRDDGGTANNGADLDAIANTFTLNVTPVNDAPQTTVPPAQATAEDAPLVFSAANGNAITLADTDGGAIEVTLAVGEGTLTGVAVAGVTLSGNGTATLTLTGTPADITTALDGLAYASRPDFHGADQIAMTTDDLSGAANATTTDAIDLTVTSVADITDDAVTTDEDVAIAFNALTGTNGATADTFEDAGRTIVGVTQGANGSVAFAADGTLTYTPNADFHGTDSFTYTVETATGGAVRSETATVTVTVDPVNDGPVAGDDGFTVAEDGSVSVPVLGNDSDVDGDTLTITHVDGQAITEGGSPVPVASGTVSLLADELVFAPASNYNGPASFAYTITDGTISADATVTGTVTPRQ